MGISSNGILVFGFPIGEENETPEFLEEAGVEDIDEFIDNELGLNDASVDECLAARKTYPVDVTSYCSYEYPMHILAVRGTEITVHRGYSKEITPEHLAVAPERISAFKAWCETHGIEYQEPKWLLCSMYG